MTNKEMIDFLEDCAKYFERRPTNGEDRTHWANVYNAENCRKIKTWIEEESAAEIERARVIAVLCEWLPALTAAGQGHSLSAIIDEVRDSSKAITSPPLPHIQV